MLTSVSIALLVTNSILLSFASLAVVLRLVVRGRSNWKYGKDDWLIIAALLFSAGLCLINIVGVPIGHFGFDMTQVQGEKQHTFLKFTFAWQFFYVLAVTAAKLSFLFFYGRFFTSSEFKRVQLGLILLACAWATAFFFCTLLQIIPIWCNWYECAMSMNYLAMYVCSSATNIAVDIAVLSVPVFTLRNIQVSKGKRTALTVIFSLGAFCLIPSLFRLAYAIAYMLSVEKNPEFSTNFTSIAVFFNMWSGIEACTSTICACLPCFGPYFSRIPILHRMVQSTRDQFQHATSERFTGGLASTRSRGRTNYRRLHLPDLHEKQQQQQHQQQQNPATDPEVKGIGLLDQTSTETSIPPALLFGINEKHGEPTTRHELEPEIEMGKISLRTGSNGEDDDTII